MTEKLTKKLLEAKIKEESTAFQAKIKKHEKETEKAVEGFFDKVDVFGFSNDLIKKLAKKDGLDVAELDEFDIEPYDILIRSKLVKYINSMK